MSADVVYQETTDIKSVLKNYFLKKVQVTKNIIYKLLSGNDHKNELKNKRNKRL